MDPFDKLLGGLAWGITSSAFDLDVEFRDEWSLGDKAKDVDAPPTLSCRCAVDL